jgi:hypothetical protein
MYPPSDDYESDGDGDELTGGQEVSLVGSAGVRMLHAAGAGLMGKNSYSVWLKRSLEYGAGGCWHMACIARQQRGAW